MLHCLHSSFDQKKWKNSISKPSAITKRDMVQLWRVCAVFFLFFPGSPGRGRLPRRAHRRYGATVARLRRIFFLRSLIGDDSPGGRREDSAQLWRICAVFFYFSFNSKVENVLGFLPYIIVPKVWRFMDTARFV